MTTNTSLKLSLLRWFLLFSIVPIVIISYFGYKNSSQSLYDSATHRLKESSTLNLKFLNNWFKFRKTDILSWSTDSNNIKFLEKLKVVFYDSNMSLEEFTKSNYCEKIDKEFQYDLFHLAKNYDYLYNLYLIDTKGNILFSTAQEDDYGTNLFSGKYSTTRFATSYKETLNNKIISFSDIEIFAPSNNDIVGFITAPMMDKRGNIIGVMSAQIKYEAFISYIQGSKDYLSYFVGKDYLLRTPIESIKDVLNVKLDTDEIKMIRDSKYDTGDPTEYINAFGQKVIGLHHHVEIYNKEWIFLSEINKSMLLASVNDLALKMILSVGILIVVLIFFSFLIAKKITKPIENLTKANIQFSQGKRDIYVEPSNENRELFELTKSFNSMINSLSKNEEELKRQTKKAQVALEVKSEFLASMSHEIRTPMNGVVGMLGLLLTSKLDYKQLHFVNIAQSSANSLLSLINDILDFSKVDAGKLELENIEFDIYYELRDFIHTMEPVAEEKGVKLLLDMSELEHNIIIADPTRLRQILNNLVGNAIKFTSNGQIEVKGILQKENNKSANLIILVKDSGIGIAEDKIESLFDSFTQADTSTTREYGGTGLGLAIVKNLVALMNGEIKVSSKLGEGSTFEFNLHVGLSDTPVLLNKKQSIINNEDIGWSKDVRLLLVEDNKTNQIVAEGILNNFGFFIDIVGNGQEAIDKLKITSPDTYALILMDCQMPVMDGYDATRAIRQGVAGDIYKDIPIIAMTANAMRGDKEKCFAYGMNDYVSKPIDLSVLQNALKRWVKGAKIDETLEEKPTQKDNFNIDLIWDKNILFKRIGNSKELVKNVLEAFLSDIDILLVQLKSDIQSEDISSSKIEAHSIKGSSANIGALELSYIASEIENFAKNNNLKGAKNKLKELEKISNKVIIAIKDYLNTQKEMKQLKSSLSKSEILTALGELKKELIRGSFIDTSRVDIFNNPSNIGIKDELLNLKNEVNNFDTQSAVKSISIIEKKLFGDKDVK